MKNIAYFVLLVVLSYSCETDSKNESSNLTGNSSPGLIGTFQLVEVLSDPGDGSGTFRSVNSEKTITFKSDGTVTSNGEMCDNSIILSDGSKGTFIHNDDVSELSSEWCAKAPFELEENGRLTIYNGCIEPCASRYKKL